MKCICFGSLFVLMYQARGQGIKSAPLCSAIFAPFGVNLAYRDTSLPGHLKNGHDKVPSDIADVVRECDPEAAVRSFERTVMPLIKDSMRAPLLQAVLAVLDEDKTIDTNSPVSWLRGYTKGAVLSASSIDLTYLLTSLVRFAILETDNNECADGIREIPDKFVSGFPKSAAPIELDEPGIIIKWPDGELNTAATRKYISDDEIRNDVDVLKKMLSKYKKPDLLPVPLVVDETEMVYVEALYAAYASAEDVPKYTRRDVDRNRRYKKDFAYQRKCYYATETIRRSLQDALLPIEYKEFDEMREEVKEGISPVMIPSYDNGYKRLTAVTSQAALVPITRSQIALLPGWIGAADKVGMCHMLANRKEIQWVDEDDGTV